MTSQVPERQSALPYRSQLEEQLQELAGEALPQALERVDLAALNFLVSGVGLARCVLSIEQASECLPEALPLSDPESVEDAMIVRESALRALEQMGQVVALLRRWLREPVESRSHYSDTIRELFHAFNNMLVGINCYSELLLMELRDGDQSFGELQLIHDTGSQAARLVRDRAYVQRLLNELVEGEQAGQARRERDIVQLLIEALCSGGPLQEEESKSYSALEIEAHAGVLPVIEGRVLREAARRHAVYADNLSP